MKRRQSEGVIVEASILARLFGVRLLKLDATVLVGPADVTSSAAAPRALQVLPSAHHSVPRARLNAAAGRGLADAIRSINEGAELLAEARRNGGAESKTT